MNLGIRCDLRRAVRGWSGVLLLALVLVACEERDPWADRLEESENTLSTKLRFEDDVARAEVLAATLEAVRGAGPVGEYEVRPGGCLIELIGDNELRISGFYVARVPIATAVRLKLPSSRTIVYSLEDLLLYHESVPEGTGIGAAADFEWFLPLLPVDAANFGIEWAEQVEVSLSGDDGVLATYASPVVVARSAR